MLSLWENTAEFKEYPALKRDIKTDVLIIGGGIAGILCGYMLKESGVDCVIIEADRICRGVTANTTAKITVQHGLIYSRLLKEQGEEAARLYLKANTAALEKYKKLCKNIDCDFKETDSYIYSLDSRESLERELFAIEKSGGRASFCEKTALPFETVGAVKKANQAQFNPLKFLSDISKKLKIYEHSAVKELKGTTAVTDGGRITAKKIIVATHFPFLNKHGSYFLKLYQKRSYIAAFENAEELDGMYRDGCESGFSFRNANGLLLIGGGSKRTGKKSDGWRGIEALAQKYYPKAQIKYRWAAQDCISLDGMPYIGNYSANTPDLYVATGFNKWGMTLALTAADLLTDIITDKKSEYEGIFSPSRSILTKQLLFNGVNAAVDMCTPTLKRCPHLGCALKWNKNERSWDCPCHGSRFSENGKLLDNPATGDINVN